ncbi:hypothetical protein AX14_009207 [Amanita brunnescens Koide BX004]|nr:hypothetical protein AX14_009207 [Amanita brunnescens Koide BX004]
MPHHPLSRPGDRVADRFTNRFSIDSYSPKKGSALFKAWCSDLAASISVLHSSGRPVIYTDGAFWNKTARGSFSFTCYHQGIWHNFFNWCPAGSSFDSEIAAIEQAIQWACIQKLVDPVFLIDNKAALTSFFDTRIRSSHMATIRINSILLDRFTSHETASFTFRYCPSHSGFGGNDRADRLTKLGAALAPDVPPWLLLSNFVNNHTKRLTAQWRLLATLPSFQGRQWMPIRHKKKRFFPAILAWPAPSRITPRPVTTANVSTRISTTVAQHAQTEFSHELIFSFIALDTFSPLVYD